MGVVEATRQSEFALGVGSSVLVDTQGKTAQPVLHTSSECARYKPAKHLGVYANARMARAALPDVKSCPACRPT